MNQEINLLEESVAIHIAAGEVVQNPASLIKELIENSIDAQAKNITVEIKNSGKDFIRISDDGYGFSYNNLQKCCQKHATSKIKTLDDIYNVKSFGMRGEALFSIRNVAKLKIFSKTKENNIGYLWEDGEISEVACNDGTVIEVSDLFYNTPARLKFLKSNEYESRQIEEIIGSYSVVYKDIRFEFIKNNKAIVFNNPIYQVFDYPYNDYIQFNNDYENNINISGYLLNGMISNKNLIFVNNRLIKDKRIVSIVKSCYRDVSGKESIAFVIFINCPYNIVDVNVHPSKLEVRFSEQSIFNNIYTAVKNAFLTGGNTNKSINENNYNNIKFQISDEIKPKDDYSDFLNINLNNNMNNVSEVKENHENLNYNNHKIIENTLDYNNLNNEKKINSLFDVNDLKITTKIKTCCDIEQEDINQEEKNNFYDDINIIGQIFARYIIGTKDNNLILIDQHAAHERIVAEGFQINHAKQKLLTPIVINYNLSETIINKLKDILDMEKYEHQLIITAIPSFFSERYIENFILQIDRLSDLTNAKSIVCDYIHEYGCKNAIKSGDILTKEEIYELIEKLKKIPNNRFCNHGRPILIEFSKKNLDNMFGRLKFSDL